MAVSNYQRVLGVYLLMRLVVSQMHQALAPGLVESISGMLLREVDGWPFVHSSPTAGYGWTIGRWSIFEQ